MSATAVDGHGELVEQLDLLVREAVRRQGVDPQRDAPVVRRIAEGVVRDHDERSLTGAVTPVPDAAAVVGELVARVSGFGPLQPFLDDPAVEEVWINDPSRVFVARHGRHELTNLILTRAQVDELVERMLKSSGRRIDLSRPFVDAMLPEGHRLHVVLEGISRGFTAVNIRKFVLKAARLSDLVELGSLTPAAAAFLEASVRAGLNVLVAGGTQAGKTTLLNCLAAAIPGGDRVVSAEEVFELRFPHPDWVPMQTRQSGLEGTGEIALRDLVRESLRMRPSRIIVGEVRSEECLDLLLALNAGLPGMCTLARQQRAGGAGEDVHPAAARGREHLRPLRRPDRGRLRRPRRAPRHRPRGSPPGQRDRGGAGAGGERHHRDRDGVRADRRRAGRHRWHAAAAGVVPTARHRRPRHPRGSPVMGALVGLGVGVGLLLVWSAFTMPRTPRAPRDRSGWIATRLGEAGMNNVSVPGVVLLSLALGAAAALMVQVVSGTPPVALAFGAMAAYLPFAVVAARARRRLREFAEVWPEAVDNLASAVRAGMSLPDALAALAVRGPEPLRPAFDGFALDYQVTGRFGECLDRLKDELADPVGDRVVEGLRIAREVGGGELGRLLRNLSGYLRDDARTRSEMESRQAWTVNGARLAVAAPWLVLLIMSFQSDVIHRYASPAGVVVLAVGASLCVAAYWLMMRIGRLPVERRILR